MSVSKIRYFVDIIVNWLTVKVHECSQNINDFTEVHIKACYNTAEKHSFLMFFVVFVLCSVPCFGFMCCAIFLFYVCAMFLFYVLCYVFVLYFVLCFCFMCCAMFLFYVLCYVLVLCFVLCFCFMFCAMFNCG